MEDQFGEIELFKADLEEITTSCRKGILTLDQLNDWKGQQLRQVLVHAKRCSPFYARQLGDVDVSTVGLDGMSRLPFTSRDDLRIQLDNRLSGRCTTGAFYDAATATAGAPTLHLGAAGLQLRFAYEEVVAANFPRQHKPVLAVLAPTGVHSFGDTLAAVASGLGIYSVNAWPGAAATGFDTCLSLLKDRKAGMVATSPGLAMTLATEARRRGLDPAKDFAVRVFMLSGELCTPALAANLKSIWGAAIYNSFYGSQQAGIMASSTADNCLRPHLSNYVFEVIHPETGQVLGENQTGELVVTSLIAGVKPLIRYRTGDVVRMTDIGGPDLYRRYQLEVAGRVNDGVTLNGMDHTAARIESAVMDGVTRCYGYQVIITRHDDEDAVIAKLVLPDHTAADMRVLVARIGARMSTCLGCRSTVMGVDDLPEQVNLGGWINWKAARLIDTREVSDTETTGVTVDIIKRLNRE